MDKIPINKIKEQDMKYDFAEVKSFKCTRHRARYLRHLKRLQERKVRRKLNKEVNNNDL